MLESRVRTPTSKAIKQQTTLEEKRSSKAYGDKEHSSPLKDQISHRLEFPEL
jgi:hypothetical protein